MKRKTKILWLTIETIALVVATTGLGLAFMSNNRDREEYVVPPIPPVSDQYQSGSSIDEIEDTSGSSNEPPTNPALITTSNDQDIYTIPNPSGSIYNSKPKKFDDVVPEPIIDEIEVPSEGESIGMAIPSRRPPRDPGWIVPGPRSANPPAQSMDPYGRPYPQEIPNFKYQNYYQDLEIIIPNVTTVGTGAFFGANITKIYAPNATTIGANAFTNVVNLPTTEVTLPVKFNTFEEKCRILNDYTSLQHNQIKFHWVDEHGDEVAVNEFRGQFNNTEDEMQFLATTTTCYRVLNCQNLSGVSLPFATTIVPLAFDTAHLDAINVPSATTIGDHAFWNATNDYNTVVTMKSKFNTVEEKNRIFGTNTGPNTGFGWDHIFFNWV